MNCLDVFLSGMLIKVNSFDEFCKVIRYLYSKGFIWRDGKVGIEDIFKDNEYPLWVCRIPEGQIGRSSNSCICWTDGKCKISEKHEISQAVSFESLIFE